MSYAGGRNEVGAVRLQAAVIYHFWPHYREPVMQAMDRDGSIAYHFVGSGEALEGVLHADPRAVSRFVEAPFRKLGALLWQPGAVRAATDRRYQALILLADPHFLSTWVAALIGKLRRVPVVFWGHGWLKAEGSRRGLLRRVFFRLSDRLLVYGERGRALGIAAGFPAERIGVVFNSLDVAHADRLIAALRNGQIAPRRPQDFFADPERPLLICTARLTAKCRFDLLFQAAASLAQQGRPVNVLLIGDGPERAALEGLARHLRIAAHFHGACHLEDVVGPMIYHADLTVSPGKIGLTAMHSLMYGTPAITHGDFDAQMPEVEAITPGVTGAFFRRDDAADLARVIAEWLQTAPPRDVIRKSARATIAANWTPEGQARIIGETVQALVGHA
ncbi:glycosyltransferase [Novosphingobium fluoreni]|uniref:glycosyltransferase n=1 Tax=Novosphingobium fluoreni TaxID=1391222 RepID=UPI003DA13A22